MAFTDVSSLITYPNSTYIDSGMSLYVNGSIGILSAYIAPKTSISSLQGLDLCALPVHPKMSMWRTGIVNTNYASGESVFKPFVVLIEDTRDVRCPNMGGYTTIGTITTSARIYFTCVFNY